MVLGNSDGPNCYSLVFLGAQIYNCLNWLSLDNNKTSVLFWICDKRPYSVEQNTINSLKPMDSYMRQ